MHRTVPLARTLIGLILGCLSIVASVVAIAAELKRGEARNVMTPYRLYNLRSDIVERQDLAAAEPERVADLLEAWRAWNAQMKVPPQL